MRRRLVCTALALIWALGIGALGIGALGPAAGQPNAEPSPGSAIEPSHFVSSTAPHQWRTSKLIGLDVYGVGDEKIGDVLDVLVGGEGKDVVVIGVGGFLSIARREVGVPFKAVDWRYGDPPRTPASSAGNPPPATTEVRARRTVDSSRRGYPDFAYVRVTREALQTAPEFKFDGQ